MFWYRIPVYSAAVFQSQFAFELVVNHSNVDIYQVYSVDAILICCCYKSVFTHGFWDQTIIFLCLSKHP